MYTMSQYTYRLVRCLRLLPNIESYLASEVLVLFVTESLYIVLSYSLYSERETGREGKVGLVR